MHIIGTAGHVDHGKSSLVSALTGTNPDRWLEEQLRGMTLDLGFAHLRFDDDIEAGIVDVPGHERFLHNMLAGAAGMELLLLVVAATEGIMPQTLEHLEILQYLNVREVIVVITKSDLVSMDELQAARAQIVAGLQGTVAAAAPVYSISTHTGSNLEQLRAAIHDALRRLPARDPDAPAYMPIDRVFALPGHGTIVTGTLMQGRIAVGETLALQPSDINARVRSLQSFGRNLTQAAGGARLAVNIPAVAANEIARGEMLVATQFVPSSSLRVKFTPLPHALPLLRRRNAVRAYVGSAEIIGTLVFDETPHTAVPHAAQLFLRRPTVAYPGTTFVARRLSPKNLLGGGRVEETASATDVGPIAGDPHEAAVLQVLSAAGLQALTAAHAARAANLREDGALAALDALTERGETLRVLRPPAYVDARSAGALLTQALDQLSAHERGQPWSMGSTSLALARSLHVDESLLVRVLSAYAGQGRIAHRAGFFSTPGHTPRLSAAQQSFFDCVIPADAESFTPVPLSEVLPAIKQSRIPGVAAAFDTLLARGILVKVNDEVYRGAQIAAIHARVQAFLAQNRQMSMAQFRDLIGTSRKYAVPLLEWFDARGITVRSGDYRMLRAKPQS